jgi:pimeloyl-ACP methyl ester carboxylesterase
VELNFKKYGSQGDHLIILHGLFGMLDNWHTIGNTLSANYQVWLIDQRNHGKSPHSDDFNYEILAEDLKHFFEQQYIVRAHVMGHSMGGKTAMQFALTYSEKLLKLIIVDIAPKAYDSHHDEIIDALQSLDLSKVSKRSDAEEVLGLKIPQQSVQQFLLKNLGREPEGYKWKMNLDALVANYDKIIGDVNNENLYNGPTLFIRGSKSDYIQDADIPVIKSQFTQAEFVTIDGVGHWVHAEAPQLFIETVSNFLAR